MPERRPSPPKRILVGPVALALCHALLCTVAGCGEDEAPVPVEVCAMYAGQCVGVPPGGICEESFCTAGVTCSAVVHVVDQAGLEQAASTATAGTCIALAPGAYPSVSLPGGVSLLGAGADRVAIGAVTLGAGSGAVVRGLHARGIVRLEDGAEQVRIAAVRISDAIEGIQVDAGGSLTLEDSEIRSVDDNAVVAIDAARLTMRRVLVEDNGGPGIWAACGDGCACAATPEIELDHVLLRRNSHVGVALVGVQAQLDTVDVLDTQQRGLTLGGGGLMVSSCSDVEAAAVTVQASNYFGVLIDGSSVSLGTSEKGIVIIDNKVGGLWLQNIDSGQPVVVANTTVSGNGALGIALGLGGSAQGIVIIDNKIANTLADMVPVVEKNPNGDDIPKGSAEVGDGLVWSDGSSATIQNLAISNSARQAVLIDGAVPAASILEVTLAGGDEQKGIVQQQVEPGTGAPDTGASGLSVQQSAGVVVDVPAAPLVLDVVQ